MRDRINRLYHLLKRHWLWGVRALIAYLALGAAASTRSLLANHMTDADNEVYEQTVSSLRQQFEDDRFADVWAEGSAMSIEEAVEYALTNNVTIFSE